MESQQEAAESRRTPKIPGMTPEQATHARELESLQLSRIRVVRELASATHPHHRESLEAALHFLDKKIAALG